jgi:hypothetical protein
MKFVKYKVNPTATAAHSTAFHIKTNCDKIALAASGLLQILHTAWPVLDLLNIRTSCGRLS